MYRILSTSDKIHGIIRKIYFAQSSTLYNFQLANFHETPTCEKALYRNLEAKFIKNQANAGSDGGCLHIKLLYLQKKA